MGKLGKLVALQREMCKRDSDAQTSLCENKV